MLSLGNLAAADHHRKLDGILGEYLAPISGKRLIDAANTIRGAAMIAHAKPYLLDEIAKAILAVEEARYGTRECRNVAIGHAIKALDEFFPSLRDQHGVLSFVRRHARNSRRATRNKAREFLAKWGSADCQAATCEVCNY